MELENKIRAAVDRREEEYEQHLREEQERRERESSQGQQNAVAEANVATQRGNMQKEGRSKISDSPPSHSPTPEGDAAPGDEQAAACAAE
eukprot:10613592-Karenia_brevis.AAC.1